MMKWHFKGKVDNGVDEFLNERMNERRKNEHTTYKDGYPRQ